MGLLHIRSLLPDRTCRYAHNLARCGSCVNLGYSIPWRSLYSNSSVESILAIRGCLILVRCSLNPSSKVASLGPLSRKEDRLLAAAPVRTAAASCLFPPLSQNHIPYRRAPRESYARSEQTCQRSVQPSQATRKLNANSLAVSNSRVDRNRRSRSLRLHR